MFYFRGVLKGFLLVIVLFIVGIAYVAWDIYQYGKHPTTEQRADAVLVLGAAVWGNRPSPVFEERILQALKLYKEGRVRWIIFTGGTPLPSYPTEADVGRTFALKHGVPMTAMLVETQSRTTWDNLQNAQTLSRIFGINTYFLVSDPLHLRRSALMAHDLGMHVYPYPTQSSRYRSFSTQLRFLTRETWLYIGYRLFRQLS